MAFTKVNAVYKCFDILDLLARQKGPMGVSEIAVAVKLNKSTVYNIVNSLVDMGVLNRADNRYNFGAKLYLLGQAIDYESLLIRKVRPYLERFSSQTRLTVSLGVRSGTTLIVLERIETPGGIVVSSTRSKVRPLLDGAHGKAVLSLLSDEEVEELLDGQRLARHTPKTVTDKKKYLAAIQRIRAEGVAVDRGELYEGIWAAAVPFQIGYLGIHAVIWAIGLQVQVNERDIRSHAGLLKDVVAQVQRELDTSITSLVKINTRKA
jgi:IclR family transcriptional regulator, KDG regulon repressor